jgi:AraC-like DNA-binding protein
MDTGPSPRIDWKRGRRVSGMRLTAGEMESLALWRQLRESGSVRQLQGTFAVATGLPLVLPPPGLMAPGVAPTQPEGVFCIRGCLGGHSGDLCLRTVRNAAQRVGRTGQAVRFRCPAGLLKVMVPVVVGERNAAILMAGPFSLRAVDARQLEELTGRLKRLNLETQLSRLETTWRYSPIISAEKLKAVLTMVGVLARYLSEAGNRLVLEEAARQSPLLQKVEALLDRWPGETVPLKTVADQVRLSPCHFCKTFKRQTGLTLSEYRTRKRVEKAKRLLLNPELRIGEAAFQAGFGSLPYFNRAFRRYAGCSPSKYRATQPTS